MGSDTHRPLDCSSAGDRGTHAGELAVAAGLLEDQPARLVHDRGGEPGDWLLAPVAIADVPNEARSGQASEVPPEVAPCLVADRAGGGGTALPGTQPDAVGGVAGCVTVVRLSDAPGRSPIERIMSTVGRVDLGLADRLHHSDDIRPYSVVVRAKTIDVVSFSDDLTRALLVGDTGARLVRRVALDDFERNQDPPKTLRLAFETPTHFRTAGLEVMIPDAFHVFGGLVERWRSLGWEVAYPDVRRVGVVPETLLYATQPIASGRPQRGFCGVVRYDASRVDAVDLAGLWRLARFGEYRGVGKHTTYGLGRMRVLADGEQWVIGRQVTCW